MLTRTINYEDFDGNPVSEIHNFHLSKSDLLMMDVEHKEGLGEILQKIVETEDKQGLVIQFKRIIMASYGKREGSRFIKSPQLSEEFAQTGAFDALFMELVGNDDAATVFIKGIIPRDLNAQADQKTEAVEAAIAAALPVIPVLPAPPAPNLNPADL